MKTVQIEFSKYESVNDKLENVIVTKEISINIVLIFFNIIIMV